MTDEEIRILVQRQQAWFEHGKTRSLSSRIEALKRLQASILAHEKDIADALQSDLHKSAEESYMCETGLVLSELRHVLGHVRRWNTASSVRTPLALFPAASRILRDPYGVVLIMSPWNYPVLLTLEPLIGAVAAGNCCIVKPSAYSPAVSRIIKTIIEECFAPEWISVIEGGRQENSALLHAPFDYIFFTGSVAVGKEVMRCASEHLTPVTLELGGKSPCIVTDTADLTIAARRLAFGKLLNAGQTCIAPDYLLVDEKIKDAFLPLLKQEMENLYPDALHNTQFVHIVNQKHFDRVTGLIAPEKVYYGGKTDAAIRCIEPTILDNVSPEDAVMQEEIFGPILPVMTYRSLEEAKAFIRSHPHPLALYLFSKDAAVQKDVMQNLRFGGGCINDTIMHIASSRMPFGGVGYSGMGAYHGKYSYRTFSREKSIVKKPIRVDMPIRYAPYSASLLRIIKLFLR